MNAGDIPSSDWTLTDEDGFLIVDCSECGEIGRVEATYNPSAPRGSEYDRAADLFRTHSRTAPHGMDES